MQESSLHIYICVYIYIYVWFFLIERYTLLAGMSGKLVCNILL